MARGGAAGRCARAGGRPPAARLKGMVLVMFMYPAFEALLKLMLIALLAESHHVPTGSMVASARGPEPVSIMFVPETLLLTAVQRWM